jgi:hypothetical protein
MAAQPPPAPFFPLPVGDPLGDSLNVCGIDSVNGHREIFMQGYTTLEQLGELMMRDAD